MRTSISTTSGRELARERDGFDAVARLADDLELGVGAQDHPEAGADELLVVGEEDADHSGSRALDRVAALRARPAVELAAEDGDPLAHPDEPVAAAAPFAAPAPVSAISSSSASAP